jgi:hypothetical protein
VIFLVRYNRREGQLVSLDAFTDQERATAEKRRLELELTLNRAGIHDEIVLLEASTEDDVRRTHRRYFESARQIITTATG